VGSTPTRSIFYHEGTTVSNRLVLGVCRTKLLTMHLNPVEGSLMKWYITYLGLHLSSSPASGNIARLYVQIEYYKKEKRFCSALSLYHSTFYNMKKCFRHRRIHHSYKEWCSASLFYNFRLCLSLAADVPIRSLQRAYTWIHLPLLVPCVGYYYAVAEAILSKRLIQLTCPKSYPCLTMTNFSSGTI
jgi:hypothetical protein